MCGYSDMGSSASVSGTREREPNSRGAKANRQNRLVVVSRVSSAPDEPSDSRPRPFLPPSLLPSPSANYLLPLITEIRQRLRRHRQRRGKLKCGRSVVSLTVLIRTM